ncbi:hypothetical protein AYR62_02425 [Secundilactobacillus paracollinoides]|uniref:polysaccharide biosynthesis protein n=2 Tax=Secundilactobacillus paracollinoides TaxID=240427 RepID=UPI00081A2C33|nr:polysaccharide biosynthesis protein [Secundilactobacillus paracollinoides]ANZ63071.1 hypothetical protein AYR62_02425 [Secundilactobacillus paracollinoides]
MKERNMRTIMQGAILLSVASLIAKILSAVYRVPFQNMVGNTGFYVYQQIYPIYGIGMTFALSGLPMFISKLVAESKNQAEKQAVLHQVFVLMLGFSLIVFFGLQGFAGPIAVAMGDGRLRPIIQAVSWMFLFSPFLSVSRGYFQGEYDMRPSASSQLIEQTVRVAVILTVAYWAMRHHWDVYRMGTWAMSSAAIAAVFASAVMAWFVTRYQVSFWQRPVNRPAYRYGTLAKRLLIEGGTISLFASMMVLMQLVDSFTVKRGLVLHGFMDDQAKALKGIYDRGQPLVQLGLVVATSFASSLLPSLTEALSHNRQQQFRRLAKRMIRISLVIASAATAGLIALMPEINFFLFGDRQGNTMLSVYVLSIVFATLIMIYNSILQSLNEFRVTLIGLAIGLLVKLVITERSVVFMGAAGASWATVIALAVMTYMLTRQVQSLHLNVFQDRLISKLVTLCVAMIIGLRILIDLLHAFFGPALMMSRLGALLVSGIGVVVGVVFFIGMALRWRLLTLREWLMLSMADKWLRLFSK